LIRIHKEGFQLGTRFSLFGRVLGTLKKNYLAGAWGHYQQAVTAARKDYLAIPWPKGLAVSA
jgi:hypothetical protein